MKILRLMALGLLTLSLGAPHYVAGNDRSRAELENARVDGSFSNDINRHIKVMQEAMNAVNNASIKVASGLVGQNANIVKLDAILAQHPGLSAAVDFLEKNMSSEVSTQINTTLDIPDTDGGVWQLFALGKITNGAFKRMLILLGAEPNDFE